MDGIDWRDGPYLFSSQTVSILGNQSTTWVNMSATPTVCADVTPPGNITNLANDTPTCTTINWTWTKPSDPDYNGTMIYNNGVFVHNSTAGATGSMWSGLTELTNYTFSSRTFDNATPPNVNMTWTNLTAKTAGCPPASITNLNYTNETCQWTNWTWDNPADADYDYLYVLKNGVWHSNVSAPANTLNWSGITAGEFASHTVDALGNMNATWVNMTAPDAEVCDVTPPLAPGNLTNITTTCSYINFTWDDAGR